MEKYIVERNETDNFECNFSVKVKHRTFEVLDPEIKYDFESHPLIYTDVYLKNIDNQELADLLAHNKYLRIFCNQDKQDSNTYLKIYTRKIIEMEPDHLEEAEYILNSAKNDSEINFDKSFLIEINYVTRAFFFLFQM